MKQALIEGCPEVVIEEFIRRCATCEKQQSFKNKTVLKPIRSDTVFGRLQVDLIDMSQYETEAGMRYILHAKDHFSKVTALSALPDKTAASAANAVRIRHEEYMHIHA